MKHVVVWLALAAPLAGCGWESAPSSTPGQPSASAAASPAPLAQMRFVAGFGAGQRESLASQKPMLVFFTAEWCRYCHKMAQEAFSQPQVVRLSEQFVCVLVDADAEPEVCRKFRVEYFPTVQFVSPRGAALNRIVGQQASDDVVLAMQAALDSVARRPRPAEPRPL